MMVSDMHLFKKNSSSEYMLWI